MSVHKFTGIELAGMDPAAKEHAAVMQHLLPQLLIIFLKRLGGHADIPLAEMDDTSQDNLAFNLDEKKVFHFTIVKKQ